MQLKHLFVFLLVFFLSVSESTIYAQESTSNFYQSSTVIQTKKISDKNTKYVFLNKHLFSDTYFLAFFSSSIHFKNTVHNQIELTLKNQKQLYQKIALLQNQHIFLLKATTSSNSISNLYIA